MIVRKPYLIFIKYFKLIHIILSLLIFYLIYRMNIFLNFLNDYIETQDNVIGQNLRSNLFSNLMFIVPILIVILSSCILWLMIKKKQKYRFYIVNILTYLIILGFIVYSYIYIGKMEVSIVDIVGVRALRDIVIITLIFKLISLTFCLSKVISSNNFEISDEDIEEYEVSLEIDSDERKRRKLKNIRYLKYSYKENKLLINLFIVIFVVIVGFILYKVIYINNKTYRENTNINTDNYSFLIDNSYLTSKGYDGSIITNNYLVIVNLKIKANIEKILQIGSFKLQIGDSNYYVTNKYNRYLSDLGNIYNNEMITHDYVNYVLVYEIPKDKINSKINLIYNENSHKYKIKLNPIIESVNILEYNIGSVINDLNVNISDYDINKSYTVNYDYCIKDNCYKSIKNIVPTLNTNYDKVIMRINSNIDLSKYSNILSIQYEINNEIKYSKVDVVKNTHDSYSYLEVNEEILNANKINLLFNTRKCKYVMILR